MSGLTSTTVLEQVLPARVRASAAFLVISNLVPVWGVLFWDWTLLALLALYWGENVVLGFFTVFRMALAQPHGWAGLFAKPFNIAFFCFHYGMFCFAHGAILYAIFGQGGGNAGDDELVALVDLVTQDPDLRGVMLVLLASHTFSFVMNGLVGGEVFRDKVDHAMFRPYGRIVVLHVIVLLGGGFVLWTGSPNTLVVALAALKTWIDLWAHRREHRPRPDAPPATETENP